MKINKISLRALFSNRRFAICFSLVAAFVFWLVLEIDQNPVRQLTLNNVGIEYSVGNTTPGSMGLDIVDEDYVTNATVTVEGPSYIVSALKSGDVHVYADLSNVTAAGTYDVTLMADNGPRYTVVAVSPATVRLTFDQMEAKEFEVVTKADGVSAPDGLIVDKPIVSTNNAATVTVRGSKSVVDTIARVEAAVTVNETIGESKSYEADLVLYDAEDQVISTAGLTLSAQKVKITVPIYKKKTVPVHPTFNNEPTPGLGRSLVTGLSVGDVSVIGPPATVDAMEQVELAPIDFNAIKPNANSFEVAFSLPERVRVLDNIETVTVTLNTAGYQTKNFTVSKNQVQFTGLATGLSAVATADLKTVTFCGSTAALRGISASTITATADLTGKSPGEYTVAVTIRSLVQQTAWPIGTYNVTVQIK